MIMEILLSPKPSPVNFRTGDTVHGTDLRAIDEMTATDYQLMGCICCTLYMPNRSRIMQ